jgi:hypothetical protein
LKAEAKPTLLKTRDNVPTPGHPMKPCWRILWLSLLFLSSSLSSVHAHGIWSHIHVTGWAADSLEPSPFRDFFAEDEVFNALLFGAAFTDSGYWPQDSEWAKTASAYSEHTHWEGFISDFIHWIRENDPPPWTNLESRKRVAFLLGCAAHGLQDEIFDSLYLPQVSHRDDKGQPEADPASDGYLAHSQLIEFAPTPYFPMDTLLELYQKVDRPVTADVIQDAVDLMVTVYVNDSIGPEVALTFYDQYKDALPWAFSHFMDPVVPGSLQSEVLPTAAYMEAIWQRLHGTFTPADALVYTFPEADRTILGRDHHSPDPWVTYIYGIGTQTSTEPVSWLSDDGDEVPHDALGTRWGAAYGRLHRFIPSQSLEPGVWYTLNVPAGLQLIDGTTTPKSLSLRFQAPCDPSDTAPCEEEPNPEPPAEPDPPSSTPEDGCAGSPPVAGFPFLLLLFCLFTHRRQH